MTAPCPCACHDQRGSDCSVAGGCDLYHEEGVRRCAAGRRCRDGDNIHDQNGERIDRLGAVIPVGHLCKPCTNNVSYALSNLPGDAAELSQLLAPSTAQRFRDPDMPSPPAGAKHHPHPRLPLREGVLALQELIDYETTVWAEAVAERIDADWDSTALERGRRGWRIERCCALLRHQLPVLVDLPPVEHRARSLTARRADGHDPDTTIRDRHDYWTVRPGWQGALLLVELHERAQRHAGRHPGDRIQIPCRTCGRRALVREHHNNKVVCRFCHGETSDDHYDDFLTAALRAHGIPVDDTDDGEDAA